MSEERSINENMRNYFGLISDGLRARPHLFTGYDKGGAVRKYFNFDGYICDPGIADAVAGYYSSVIKFLQKKSLFDLAVFLKNANRDGNCIAGATALAGLICADRDTWMSCVYVQLADGILGDRVSLGAYPGPDGTEQEKAVLLVDQISNGEEVLRAVDFLESCGYRIIGVIALFVWPDLLGHGFMQKLKGIEVALHYLGELKQIGDSGEIDFAFNEELLARD